MPVQTVMHAPMYAALLLDQIHALYMCVLGSATKRAFTPYMKFMDGIYQSMVACAYGPIKETLEMAML